MDQDDKAKAAGGANASGTDRRAFLAAAGKFAVVTPPAMTILLSTSLSSPAVAASGRGSYGGGGYNNDHNDHGDHDNHNDHDGHDDGHGRGR